MMKNFLDRAMKFYEEHGMSAYMVMGVTIFFLILLTFIYHTSYIIQPTQSVKITIIVTLILSSICVLFILGDLAKLGLRPAKTHKQLIEELRGNLYINKQVGVIKRRLTRAMHSNDEAHLSNYVDTIMQVVQGEWRYVPMREIFKLFARIFIMVALYGLISINVGFLSQTMIFNGLGGTKGIISDLLQGADPQWLVYFYNTVIAMFSFGYDLNYPVHLLSRILTMSEIFSGIFSLTIILSFMVNNTYKDMGSIRDALRSYLIQQS